MSRYQREAPTTDTQMGLVVTTPIIAVFALALRHMGVLPTTEVVTAVLASISIAVALFLTQ